MSPCRVTLSWVVDSTQQDYENPGWVPVAFAAQGRFVDAPALRDCLTERFASIWFDQAKEDIEPFLNDPREVSLWSPSFFRDLIPLIQTDH